MPSVYRQVMKSSSFIDVKVADGATALDVLVAADAADDSLTVTIVESGYGLCLSAINGVYAGSYTEKCGMVGHTELMMLLPQQVLMLTK